MFGVFLDVGFGILFIVDIRVFCETDKKKDNIQLTQSKKIYIVVVLLYITI